jgi:hypothetical protein
MRGGVLVCTVQIYLMRQAAQDRQQGTYLRTYCLHCHMISYNCSDACCITACAHCNVSLSIASFTINSVCMTMLVFYSSVHTLRTNSTVIYTFALYSFNDDVNKSASDVVSGASRSSSYSSSNSSRTGLYCVEFLRGQIDIFHFKRLYDGVRRQLSALVCVNLCVKLLQLHCGFTAVHNACISCV